MLHTGPQIFAILLVTWRGLFVGRALPWCCRSVPPRSCLQTTHAQVLAGSACFQMHASPLSSLAKVEKPKAMDSSSRDAIWLSPLRVNCLITSLEGSKSAYSMRPSITSTAATLGGVLLASQSNCKGFCPDSTHRLHVNISMYTMIVWLTRGKQT